jgi:glycine betaine/proline transport system ATP-binding protein
MAPKIACKDLWKVFGARCLEAMSAMQGGGVDKGEIREQFGCVAAVTDVNFEVADGEIFCIMGLSGSGKSTVVRHINRLIEPTRGQVLIDGQDIGEFNASELRHLRATKIGMVFQDRGLLPHRNVRDNVSFALELRGVKHEVRDAAAEQVLSLVQLSGWGDLMPDELSGGMQQRVGIARALAANPDILLMDEPFSALDPLIRRELQSQFLELSAVMKKTTIFITHDLDEAIRLGSRIAIMKDGAIVQVGTPEEIITNPMDDYVADFVRGISRLEVVKAHSVMQPLAAYQAGNGESVIGLPEAAPEADLAELVDIAMHQSGPIAIIEDGEPVGVVTLTALLKGIRGASLEGAETNV